jgi:hypothetical protein
MSVLVCVNHQVGQPQGGVADLRRQPVEVREFGPISLMEECDGFLDAQEVNAGNLLGALRVFRCSNPVDLAEADKSLELGVYQVVPPWFFIVGDALQHSKGIAGIECVAGFFSHFPRDGLQQGFAALAGPARKHDVAVLQGDHDYTITDKRHHVDALQEGGVWLARDEVAAQQSSVAPADATGESGESGGEVKIGHGMPLVNIGRYSRYFHSR